MIYLKGLFVSTHSRPKAAGKFGIMCKPDVSFQHTAARRRLVEHLQEPADLSPFQHTAARRRLDRAWEFKIFQLVVSTHSRPKAAGEMLAARKAAKKVSTHSRPKAAGVCLLVQADTPCCFNTQPPEGGWDTISFHSWYYWGFNTQPPEGGWRFRPPACGYLICFNTQPPEGGWVCIRIYYALYIGFNTQPPEGGWPSLLTFILL